MLSESTYKEKLPNESGVLHPTYHDVQIKHVRLLLSCFPAASLFSKFKSFYELKSV